MTIRPSLNGMELWSSFHSSGVCVELLYCAIMTLLLLLFIIYLFIYFLKFLSLNLPVDRSNVSSRVSLKYYCINF